MAAEIVALDRREPDKAFSRCRDVIRSGGIIAFPTDTFYGLGADPRNAAAIERLFIIKGRNADQPILLLLPDAAAVREWTPSVSPAAEKLMMRFWPGPLTLVFTARPDVLLQLTAGSGRIGLRVPGNEMTRSLLGHLGSALTGTSANRSGEPDPRSAGDVIRQLEDRIDLVLDGGPAIGNRPSTVVDVTGGRPRVIRQGAIAEGTLFP
jgi:L-threonylcarbamoyladenylate synthase